MYVGVYVYYYVKKERQREFKSSQKLRCSTTILDGPHLFASSLRFIHNPIIRQTEKKLSARLIVPIMPSKLVRGQSAKFIYAAEILLC